MRKCLLSRPMIPLLCLQLHYSLKERKKKWDLEKGIVAANRQGICLDRCVLNHALEMSLIMMEFLFASQLRVGRKRFLLSMTKVSVNIWNFGEFLPLNERVIVYDWNIAGSIYKLNLPWITTEKCLIVLNDISSFLPSPTFPIIFLN